ncbi:alpha/beta hydrolase [Streptomyces sp. NBC_00237]|uniref:alpha/beta fold hydrolase n=1 Tax=Streptomyces sp. NBC_00237 TaxID=2975687 RepID=UPI00224E1177|nr:alpha/beta hydrolase [Streptomyces sp. NBC_00237]MCX5206622.1 alpha/beta hydrolase [Streptomyces sp. NBC_00237]
MVNSPADSPPPSSPYSSYPAPDGTRLAYRVIDGDGDGDGSTGTGTHADTDTDTDESAAPLVCLPGGPLHDSRYLGDLGGLATVAGRRLLLLDFRGSGGSEVPEDSASYRCDRLVEDVEALRVHLGLPALDLLAHCAGANVAVQYAARHPERVTRLTFITPSTRAVGIAISDETRREGAELRKDEAWFPEASAALRAVAAGETANVDFAALTPFFWGRWDDAARAHTAESQARNTNRDSGPAFAAEGAFDPEATRAALAELTVPVGLLAGEYDLNSPPRSTEEFAELFPAAETTYVLQPGAGHFPWVDGAKAFATAAASLLRRPTGN